MKGIEQLFDVTGAIASAKPHIRTLTPGLAAMNAAVFASLSVVAAALSWYFDFDSTMTFISPFSEGLIGSLPGTLIVLIPFIGLLVTLSPSMVQLFLPAYARIKLVALLLYGVVIFDAMTDFPRVKTFLAVYKPIGGDMVELAIWQAAHYVLLLFASVGFEFLLVFCLFATLMCVAQAFSFHKVLGNG